MKPVDRSGGSVVWAALTVVVWSSAVAQTIGRPESGQASLQLAQGVIVQLNPSPTLYLPDPASGIDAVAVETGQVRWHDTMATVPLVARGARLLALASRFPGRNDAKFVFLDTESGRIVAELPTLEIPHWGPLTYLGGQGSEAWFALEGRSKGGRDFLIWRYRTQRRVQGATPPKLARPLTEGEPEDSGVVEVDLAAATMHPTRETFADRTVPTKRDRAGGSEWGPFEIDGVRVTLVRAVGRTATMLLLRRRRGGKALSDVVVSKRRANDCSLSASLDWHDVLSGCQIAGAQNPFMYALTVYAAASGQRIGHIVLDTWPSSFVVWNKKLVYFFPWHVGMVDLGSGERAFDRPTRDIAVYELPPP